jgi:predicted ABC-type ATPase
MPTPVVISGGQAVRVAPSPYAALREAVNEVTRALEDQSWTNLSSTAGENRGDAPHHERKALIERSRLFCRRSPLAKQSVKLLQNYVLGQGVTVRANDKEQVARIVDEFWEDPVNAAVFTSHDAMSDALRTIYTDGDLFLVLFPDKDTGSLQLGILDALFVEDIVSDPNNWKVAKWYKVNRPVGHYDFATGHWIPDGTAEEFVWYRDWRNDDEVVAPPVTGKRKRGKGRENSKAPARVEEGLVYHVAINRRGLFGEPEPAAALDWLKAHKDFMENRATINAAAATIAWRKKQKGSVGSVQVAAEQLRSRLTASAAGWDTNPPPAAGSTVVENENSTMEWVSTNTGAANALADERILRMMVGSAFGGIPNHIFGDEAAANLATATAMNTPMQRMYAQWQKLLGDVIDDVLGFLLDCQHEAGNIGPRDDSKKYGGDERHDNPEKVLDKPQATAEPRRPGIPAPTPPQLGAGGPYRPRVREAMSPIYDQDGYVVGFVEHGDIERADYYTKYHPVSAPRHPRASAASSVPERAPRDPGSGPGSAPDEGPGTTVPGPDPEDERFIETHKRYILDDGSWRPDRVKLHEEYVRKAQEGAEVTDMPIVYMTGGGAGSGKSTFLKDAAKYDIQTEGVAYVNADKAKVMLPEYEELIELGSSEAAAVTHVESSYMSKLALRDVLENRHTVIYDAVGDSGIDSLHGKVGDMREWGGANTKVFADYMSIPVNVALARAEWRALNSKDPEERGRRIRPSIIKAAYADIPHTVTAAIERDTFDRLRVWDNDVPEGAPPILMATYERGKGLEIADEVRWEGFSASPSRYAEPRFKEHGDKNSPWYAAMFHPGPGADTMSQFFDPATGRWSAERQALHEKIIAKILDNPNAKRKERPVLYMTGGGYGSGKSTMLKQAQGALPDPANAILVDPDAIKDELPEFGEMAAKGDWGAATAVHEESSWVAKIAVDRALAEGRDTIYDTSGDGGWNSMTKKIARFRARAPNALIYGVYVSPLSVKEAIARVAQRAAAATGARRHVPRTLVVANHESVGAVFGLAADTGLFDYLQLYRSDGAFGDPLRLVAHAKDGRITVDDEDAYQAFLRSAP